MIAEILTITYLIGVLVALSVCLHISRKRAAFATDWQLNGIFCWLWPVLLIAAIALLVWVAAVGAICWYVEQKDKDN